MSKCCRSATFGLNRLICGSRSAYPGHVQWRGHAFCKSLQHWWKQHKLQNRRWYSVLQNKQTDSTETHPCLKQWRLYIHQPITKINCVRSKTKLQKKVLHYKFHKTQQKQHKTRTLMWCMQHRSLDTEARRRRVWTDICVDRGVWPIGWWAGQWNWNMDTVFSGTCWRFILWYLQTSRRRSARHIQWNPALRTPLNSGHPWIADTHDITDKYESPDCPSVDFNT